MKKELTKIRQVFGVFDDKSVCYCHWKSNQHLGAALAGETDLDILVDNGQSTLCRHILQECGCKQVAPQSCSQYPGIEDWLAFDEETGSLAHIHLHFRLIAGSHPKNYHLPLENWLLSDRASLHCLAIPAHEKELIVLVVRMAFKIRNRDVLRACLVPSYGFIPLSLRAELDWLLERAHVENIAGHLSTSGLSLDADLLVDFLERYAEGGITPAYFFGFRVKLARSLKKYRIRSFASVRIRQAKTFIRSRVLQPQTKKSLFGRGVFFALVGADGSGKTTLAKDLLSWLSWKLEARVLYFGIPKTTRMYQCLVHALDITGRLGTKARRLRSRLPDTLLGSVSRGIDSLLWIYIGFHRCMLSRQAKRGLAKGFVLIGERFPLGNFMDMAEPMDGPRLQKRSRASLPAGLERFFYNRIELPDRLFVLKAGAAILHARKDITPMSSLCEKADAVNRIKADERTSIVDAEASYESVLRMIKTDIWNML